MSMPIRLILALVIGLAVGIGFMAYDRANDAEWVVSPRAIAEARSQGKQGVETKPGTVTVRPIRSEIADALPIKWGVAGLAAFAAVFFGLRKRS